MSSKIADVATRFVDLVLKYKQWNEIKSLPVSELQILFEIVSIAGFDSKIIMPGKLFGHYCEQDGSRTGERYPINKLCPFKVVDQEGNDCRFATGWLDCAFSRVVCGATRRNEGREELIKIMIAEIEGSVPLEPIQLTSEGDLLCEYPPSTHTFGYEYFMDHTRDNHQLSSCVGVHEYCDSWMDRKRATRTHDVLVCRGCYLRVLFSKEVRTYGDLRQVLASQRAQAPA